MKNQSNRLESDSISINVDLDDSMYRKIINYFNKQDIDEELKPASKISSYLTKIQLSNPMGTYKRGFDISFDTKTENNVSEKLVVVNEKKFSKRLRFILLLMIVQSIGFSFAMTASISFPWTFNIVIPFTLDLLPFDLKELIEWLIRFIQDLLRPLDPLIAIIEEIIKFLSTFNPVLMFTGTFWIFNYFGWIDSDKFLNIPDDYNNGSKTGMDIFAYNLEQKFPFLGDMLVPFIIFIFSIISFFLLITRAKKLLFELIKEKNFKKHRKNIRKKIVPYYMSQGVVELDYIKNRSTRIKLIKRFYNSLILLGIFVVLSPVFLALLVIFL